MITILKHITSFMLSVGAIIAIPFLGVQRSIYHYEKLKQTTYEFIEETFLV